MITFKEDEELLHYFREMADIIDKLKPSNNSKIKLVLPIDERNKLEDRYDELYKKIVSAKIELDRIRIRETPHHKAIISFLRKLPSHTPIKTKKDFREFWDYHFHEILDFHEDNELIARGTFIRNYFTLIPPYVRQDFRQYGSATDVTCCNE